MEKMNNEKLMMMYLELLKENKALKEELTTIQDALNEMIFSM